jgi:argininosuccinate lyase
VQRPQVRAPSSQAAAHAALVPQCPRSTRHAARFVIGAPPAAAHRPRLAVEIRHLQRTEVLEAEEYFSPGQKGSSAMPHKKNPDVFELIRARCNKIQALPNEIALMTTNLPSGYHRDLQLLKENLFPAFKSLNECLEMTAFMLQSIRIKDDIFKDEKYDYLFSVDAVNEQVLNGIPFREAYKNIGSAIEKGEFKAPAYVKHTHEGSIGNLCNEQIQHAFKDVLSGFNFEKVDTAIYDLIA